MVIKFEVRSIGRLITGKARHVDAFRYDDHRVLFDVLFGMADRVLFTFGTCTPLTLGDDLAVGSPNDVGILSRIPKPRCEPVVGASSPELIQLGRDIHAT